MATTIEVNGSRKTTFVEGNGFIVKYKNQNEVMSNNTSKRHVYKGNDNQKKIFLSFNLNSDILHNKIYISEDTFNDYNKSFSKDYKLSPFKDNDKKFILAKTNIKDNVFLNRSTGGNEFFLSEEFKPFLDKEEITTKKVVNETELSNLILYPYSFNYNKFFNRGFRLDVFGNVEKIKRTQTVFDDIKGLRSNFYKYSKNAFGNNNNITDHLKKNYDTISHYEDDINNLYLYNNRQKTTTFITGRNRNPITGVETTNTNTVPEIIYSSETRYFIKKDVKLEPFREFSHDSNNWWLSDEENLFKSNDVEINQKLLETRDVNDAIIEDKKYYSRGKDIDLSNNIGIDSIVFHEVAN
tara:strand:- start:1121 stop:2179 length:1059 start_codon:yes stop_codon:yes gene_type:complete